MPTNAQLRVLAGDFDRLTALADELEAAASTAREQTFFEPVAHIGDAHYNGTCEGKAEAYADAAARLRAILDGEGE